MVQMSAHQTESHSQQAWYRSADTLDIKVVRTLARELRLTDAKVRDEILSRKASSVSTTYQVLLKRKQSGQGLPHFAPDILAEKWPRLFPRPSRSDSIGARSKDNGRDSQGGHHVSWAPESTGQIEMLKESNIGHPTSAFTYQRNNERSLTDGQFCEVNEVETTDRAPHDDQFTTLSKFQIRNHEDSPITERLNRQNCVEQSSSDFPKQKTFERACDVLRNSQESYKQYLEQLRGYKHKLYKGVLKTIGERRDSQLPWVPQGHNKQTLTFQQEARIGNRSPGGGHAHTFPLPRDKSASSKSVRFLIAEEDMLQTRSSSEVMDRTGPRRMANARFYTAHPRARNQINTRASSAEKPQQSFKLTRVTSAAESNSVHLAPPNSVTNQSRPDSSGSLLSGKTWFSDNRSTDTSSRRPIRILRHHHVFKVKDDVSDKLVTWDAGELDLKMAGEQIPGMIHHQLLKPHQLSNSSPAGITKLQLRGVIPLQRLNTRNVKIPQLELVSYRQLDTSGHSRSISDVTNNDKPQRHRYSFMTSSSKPRDEYDDGRLRVHIRIPTGDEKGSGRTSTVN